MARIAKKPKSDNLYQALLLLKTEEEAYRFFQDLCTVTELRAMEQRFDVALLLKDGMSATISRVNRSLSFGAGGYQTVFQRMEEEKDEQL